LDLEKLKKQYKKIGYIILEDEGKFIIVSEETSSKNFNEEEYQKYDINGLEEEFQKLNKL
jgi:hypothetical protein